MSAYQNIYLQNRNQVVYLTLNRPQVCNSFNKELIADVRHAVQEIKNTDARIFVIDAAGKHFCAGGDLQWMKHAQNSNYQDNYDDMYQVSCMFDDIYSLEIPTIAKIQGAAIGGGVGFVAACDIAICSENAIFSLSEARSGLIPACTTAYLLHKISTSYLQRYFITGEKLTAQMAEKIGLISEICDANELDEKIDFLCKQILECGPQATKMAKNLLRVVPQMDYQNFLSFGAETVAKMRTSQEAREGFVAFLEKRNPSWRKEQ